MAYGLKYYKSFRNTANDLYRIEIYEKDYAGLAAEMSTTNPSFILKYQSGDQRPITSIRASEATINLWSEDWLSLDDFYSEDDEQFRIDFILISVYDNETATDTAINLLKWRGFIVQDDCQEELQDPPYTIGLNATDNLALLKDITFDVAAQDILEPDELISKHLLFDYLKIALKATGIVLPLRIFLNVFEDNHNESDTDELFSQTRLFSGKYLNDDGTWENMYQILEDILFRFNATILQADGYWNIVRLQELRQFENTLPGVEFDEEFTNATAIEVTKEFTITIPQVSNNESNAIQFIGANAVKRIQRPYKFTKETFNYQQPAELIRNINLQEVGDLITEYIDGDGFTVKEYELPHWFETGFGGQPDVFIRVITDTEDVEQERYIVLRGGSFGGPFLRSSSFFLNEKDRVNVSFQLRTSDSQTGSSNNTFLFRSSGALEYRLNFNNGVTIDGSWSTIGGSIFSYSSAQNINDWTTFSVESLGVPQDGYFDIALNQLDFDGTINETHYKDIIVTYIPYINDSTKIIGHTHNQTQSENIKNNFDEQIAIDDSPKNAIAGALFLNVETDGKYDTLTALWHRRNISESRRLGDIITEERKQVSYVPRTVIDGQVFCLRSGIELITPLSVALIESLTDLNFILGVCEFDYFNNDFKSTFWELYETGEADEAAPYEFKYLFETT